MEFISFEKMAAAINADLKSRYLEKFPKACSAALSRTAVRCKLAMQDHMRANFDRPTKWAIDAVRAVPATVETMSSAVLLREFSSKGTPAEKYLGPQIMGGGRSLKRSEKALASAQYLKPGGFMMPGDAAKMDQFGNQSRGEIVKILSVLRAFGEQGYRANRKKGWSKKTRVGQIFAVRQGNTHAGLKPGVYRRTDTGVVCLMRFVSKAPNYRVRLPFDELVMADAARIFPEELERAVVEIGK
ncbi:hypothetical protein [Acidocella sp.]|uniref:hypothetical protein n=1 Tax=Acidocella sp. TaxID=50710 RepID=UPI0018547AFB|nr:hypothetical protein [Acidocella sp.]NNM56317.1 hypothetical protein [Acidocella sp.]